MLAARIVHQGDSRRPWLVWLHGFLGNSNEWQGIAQHCQMWSSLAIDLPGHGGSVTLPCQGFAEVTQQISATLRHYHITHYWLIGYSLGGRIAMYHACNGEVSGLHGVLIEGGHPGLESESLRFQRYQQDRSWAARFRAEPFEKVLIDWYQQPVFAQLNEEQRKALVALRTTNNAHALANMLEATSLGRQPWLLPQLQRLPTPIVLVCGADDHKFQTIARATSFPLHIVPQAGHNAHLANPAEFVTVIHTCLENKGSEYALPT